MQNDVARAMIESLSGRVERLEEQMNRLVEEVGRLDGKLTSLVLLVGAVSAGASLIVQVLGLLLKHS